VRHVMFHENTVKATFNTPYELWGRPTIARGRHTVMDRVRDRVRDMVRYRDMGRVRDRVRLRGLVIAAPIKRTCVVADPNHELLAGISGDKDVAACGQHKQRCCTKVGGINPRWSV